MAFNQLTALDFNDIKASIKDYLKSSDVFTDYNFEGSALSNLIDVLAYNTYYTAFNTNFVINEAFLDSATIRDNVVRLAKLLNYTSKSTQASIAEINIVIDLTKTYTNNNYPDTLTLKAGICFSSTNDNGNYIFSIPNDSVCVVDKATGTATFNKLKIYEGTYLNYFYKVDTSTIQKFLLPNKNVDVNTLNVSVTEDDSIRYLYTKTNNIINQDKNSRIYFIQESYDEKYELIFGDGVFGKKLNNNNIINLSYIVSNGNLGNNCNKFNFIGKIIDNNNNTINTNIVITTNQESIGGSNIESISSIKYYAPRYFQSQGRAVTAKDFETLVPLIYSNIDSIAAYGGEDELPPQYGTINLVIKPKTGITLSPTEKNVIKNLLKEYSVASVVPIIKDPSVIYIELTSSVYYNPLLTTKTSDALKQNTINTIVNLNTTRDFNKFGGKFKYSKLVSLIDNTDASITSNITTVKLRKNLSVTPNIATSYTTCFSNVIASLTERSSLTTTGFKILNQDQSKTFYFEDNGLGVIHIYTFDSAGNKSYLPSNTLKQSYGTINYETGEVYIKPITITSTTNLDNTIYLFVVPQSNDIVSIRNTYLTIDTTNLSITLIEDTIASGQTTSGIGVIPASSQQ